MKIIFSVAYSDELCYTERNENHMLGGFRMEESTRVLEYKCPCCNAGLVFGSDVQKMTCEYCDNTFELDAVLAFNESLEDSQEELFSWQNQEKQEWDAQEQSALNGFQCPACGGEIISDEHTAATFCPFCDNPTIMPSRVSGGLKPDAVLPFRKSREDATAAFLKLCKGKPLLPKEFTSQQRLEKITGMYVPFWLYDCDGDFSGTYKATRVHRWSDSHYNYTRTEHFLLNRKGSASFTGIPMDGSSKMEDIFMESIEPFDYSQMVPFEMGYLSGYFADKYDVPSENGEPRIRERVQQTLQDQIQTTLLCYATAIPTNRQIQIQNSTAKYVLLPVWMLNTKYNGKIYTFAMNGQTGKMTGSFPVCPKRSAAWFAGIAGVVTAVSYLLQMLF